MESVVLASAYQILSFFQSGPFLGQLACIFGETGGLNQTSLIQKALTHEVGIFTPCLSPAGWLGAVGASLCSTVSATAAG